MAAAPVIVVTGFEPFLTHASNPSEAVAKALDGRSVGGATVRGVTLPVDHRTAVTRVAEVLEEVDLLAIVHLGLAEGRARLALERVAVNVMDFALPDNGGHLALDEPCVPGGPAAYWSTLPLRAILTALAAEDIPAYISSTAGTFLCNQTLYTTLHRVAGAGRRTRVGFVHLPLLPSMVVRSGLEQASMDLPLMLRGVEVVLEVIAAGEVHVA